MMGMVCSRSGDVSGVGVQAARTMPAIHNIDSDFNPRFSITSS
jgi:hypothetical protein